MRIDILFDTSCPWCFIGKRRLERALAQRTRAEPEIQWRPYLLNPAIPPEGMDRTAYLEKKFGGSHRVRRIFEAVAKAGLAEDIAFDFSHIEKTPNTVISHRFIHYAKQSGSQEEAVEAVFKAYFTEGRDIGDLETLLIIGDKLGLERTGLRAYLESDRDVAMVEGENTRAHRLGINGVPCYIFNDTNAIAGAQESEVFLRIIDLAMETEIAVEPVS